MKQDFIFVGEFGYFHQVILAYINRFVKANPHRHGDITLHVYEGCEYIIHSLWPDYFRFMTYPLFPTRMGWHCKEIEVFLPSEWHIRHMFDEPLPKWLGDIPYKEDLTKYYLEKPIPYPQQPGLDAFRAPFKRTVVLFLRYRDHMEQQRNFVEENTAWIDLLKKETDDPSTLCCIYGLSAKECIIPPFVKQDARNIIVFTTMEEATYFFNTCDTTYMNNSGLEDFAKNCGVKHLVVCPSSNKILFNASLYYNPFNTRIEIFGEYKLQI